MKIHLAKSAGFCFGVKRALDIAFNATESGAQVYMLGDTVHNEEVIKEIKERGIKKIKRLTPGKDKYFLIQAHGIGQDTIARAAELGYKIIDATCRMVKEIHNIAKNMEAKGYKIIIIGDRNHDEVKGIIGQLKTRPTVIEDSRHIPLNRIKKLKKAAVVVQSTQNFKKVLEIIDILKAHIGELKFFNTICIPTRIKQKEIERMPLESDVMIIIGSKVSANTRRLYEISVGLNPRTFWVQSKKDIKSAWFKGAKNVGVSAGASTPNMTIKDIVEYIKTLASNT